MNQEPILFILDRDHFSPGSTTSDGKIVNGLKIDPFVKIQLRMRDENSKKETFLNIRSNLMLVTHVAGMR